MSPKTKSKAVGVHIGFQLNMIVTILKKAVDEGNANSKRIFLCTLHSLNSKSKSILRLVEFTQRKTMNLKFHATADLVEYYVISIESESANLQEESIPSPTKRIVPCILPLGVTNTLTRISPHVYDVGPGINRYAAVGRITGVMLSIIRIQKLTFFNKLAKQNFSKLSFLQRI